ncbi:MAG: hypothetical protein CBD47_02075 [Synechococcus sp. TMED187]|nr:MAG: hypothetical protein CBD47_02075 [Synechococcus sp. TMED187]
MPTTPCPPHHYCIPAATSAEDAFECAGSHARETLQRGVAPERCGLPRALSLELDDPATAERGVQHEATAVQACSRTPPSASSSLVSRRAHTRSRRDYGCVPHPRRRPHLPHPLSALRLLYNPARTKPPLSPRPTSHARNADLRARAISPLEIIEFFFLVCFTIEMLFKLIAMGFVFHRNAYLRSAWCAATLPRASWVRGLGRFTKWEAVCGRVRACACVRACARMG